ncbi:Protein of unknown function [Peptoniphilus asaccharolyticus DSM 20463]|uniref:Uncharacterized protein n=1 Tax=Peptoniphilus asaccharolyticus DSM 20463 TaxID=573058 RepID=A0A1W1UQF7_PEPAS|nr:DUF1292 domain-containing protein [Peptoniphilus asaccharolyticus]MBL7575026.1 DUF1292 domain-containing protein [Peptoniphilus asaccharolyticus]SMB83300.1 Protein of unknown function [Peptoniphilus asaccharolyticus DSM 20463]
MHNEHNHDHEEEFEYDVIGIPLEDGTELNCIVIDIFDVEGEKYIALIPEDEIEDGDVILFKYAELSDEEVELTEIEEDEEFTKVSEAFSKLNDEE